MSEKRPHTSGFEAASPLPVISCDTVTVFDEDGRAEERKIDNSQELDCSQVAAELLETIRVNPDEMTLVPLLRLKLAFREESTPTQVIEEARAICQRLDTMERQLGGSGLSWRCTPGGHCHQILMTLRPVGLELEQTVRRLKQLADQLDQHRRIFSRWCRTCEAEVVTTGDA